jgi:hypothetical protein
VSDIADVSVLDQQASSRRSLRRICYSGAKAYTTSAGAVSATPRAGGNA